MHFKRAGSQTTKSRSKKSERAASKIFKGRVQPNSGACDRARLKGDVVSDIFLVDDKTTDKESYSFKYATWKKLSNEAWAINKRPAMRIDFPEGSPLYVIDETTIKEMLEAYEQQNKAKKSKV